MKTKEPINRRDVFKNTLLLGTGFLGSSPFLGAKPAASGALEGRPIMPWGVQIGDISPEGWTLWSASDRPAEMIVELADNAAFNRSVSFRGVMATKAQDYTARLQVKGVFDKAELLHYRVSFVDPSKPRLASEPFIGTLRPIAAEPQRLRFCFGGDTAGQGWGINPDFGGMTIYSAILLRQPDFFVHCGDIVYADGPLQSQLTLDDGRIWKNIVTPAKSKVAETLDEFRGNYQYNLLDENVRRFNASIPQLVQWDDHETVNNWYPQEILDDARYTEKNLAVLSSRARKAFFEYTPISPIWTAADRIYRSYRYGSHLEVFMIDLRSYRGPNSPNRQEERSPATDFLGSSQLTWLKNALAASQATWKVISSDMPLGLVIADGPKDFEALANGDGPALGRELEIADLLKSIKDQNIANVVWITADVHYAAAHYYDPNKAQFKDFKPFWEFVSGPLHAGTFGPNGLDNTFGPEVRWKSIPDDLKPNRSPLDGYQFFGEVELEAQSKTMTVRQFNLKGEKVFEILLRPEPV